MRYFKKKIVNPFNAEYFFQLHVVHPLCSVAARQQAILWTSGDFKKKTLPAYLM